MTSNKARITKAERLAKLKPDGVKRIFVYYEGKDTGRLDGVEITRAEFDKIKTDNDTEIVICYVDTNKDGET